MIRFENVTKVYAGQERPALDSVNLEITKGEFVFLVGKSGSGKSTFLRLILREERPTSGIIHGAGKDLGKLANHKVPELRRQLGTVFRIDVKGHGVFATVCELGDLGHGGAMQRAVAAAAVSDS